MKKIQSSKSHILKFQGHDLEKTEKELDPSKESKIYKHYLLQLKKKEDDQPYQTFTSAKEIAELFDSFEPHFLVSDYEAQYTEAREIIEQALDTQKFHHLKRKIRTGQIQFLSTLIKRLFQISMEKSEASLELALQFCSYLYENGMTSKTIIRRAVDRLVHSFDEIIVDVPNFPLYLRNILIQLLHFGILRPKFIHRIPTSLLQYVMQYDQNAALFEAYGSQIQSIEKIQEIKERIKDILQAYLLDPESKIKFAEILQESPLESVRVLILVKVIECSFECSKSSDREKISKLIVYLGIQLKAFKYSDLAYAFDSLIQKIYSYKLDYPLAIETIAKFIIRATADRVLPPRYVIEGESFEQLSEDHSEIEVFEKATVGLKSSDLETKASVIWSDQ